MFLRLILASFYPKLISSPYHDGKLSMTWRTYYMWGLSFSSIFLQQYILLSFPTTTYDSSENIYCFQSSGSHFPVDPGILLLSIAPYLFLLQYRISIFFSELLCYSGIAVAGQLCNYRFKKKIRRNCLSLSS